VVNNIFFVGRPENTKVFVLSMTIIMLGMA